MILTAKHKTKTFGQSTVELALLIPIFVFLMVVFVKVFDVNMSISNEDTKTHVGKLDKFDHGNGLIFDPISGDFLDAGQYIELVPGGELLGFEDLGDVVVQQLASIAANRLLGFLFDKIGFFQDSKIIPDFTQAYITSATNSYIQSGFTEVDWEGAAWDGATAGLSSQQATGMFQGAASSERNTREFLGSGLQSASTSYTASQGDELAMAQGFVDGLLTSDSFGEWSEEGNNSSQILKGATRGAISSTTAGAIQGNFDLADVAKSAGMGALSTKAMADVVTSNRYKGDDPRGSMTYGAFNSGVSTLISGGNVKDAAFASASGAFYSSQVQGKFGDSSLYKAAGSIGFESAVSFAQGNGLEAVGQSAMAAAMGYGTGQATGWTSTQISQGAENLSNPNDIKNYVENLNDEEIEDSMMDNQTALEESTENDLVNDIYLEDEFGGSG